MPMSKSNPKIPIRNAATVILLRRDGESARVLMGQRGSKAVFMPDKYVFPGGAVDPEDEGTEPSLNVSSDTEALLAFETRNVTPTALVNAAVRELREETGLRLGKSTQSGMTFFFRAITPEGRPRRFDARFFLVEATEVVGDPDDFSQASDELSNIGWIDFSYVKSLSLPFITEVVLAELETVIKTRKTPVSVPFFFHDANGSSFRQIGLDSA